MLIVLRSRGFTATEVIAAAAAAQLYCTFSPCTTEHCTPCVVIVLYGGMAHFTSAAAACSALSCLICMPKRPGAVQDSLRAAAADWGLADMVERAVSSGEVLTLAAHVTP